MVSFGLIVFGRMIIVYAVYVLIGENCMGCAVVNEKATIPAVKSA
jgi:hypothetical protein